MRFFELTYHLPGFNLRVILNNLLCMEIFWEKCTESNHGFLKSITGIIVSTLFSSKHWRIKRLEDRASCRSLTKVGEINFLVYVIEKRVQ